MVQRGLSRALFSGAQCHSKRQWAQTGAQGAHSSLMCGWWNTGTGYLKRLWSLLLGGKKAVSTCCYEICSGYPCLRSDWTIEKMISRNHFQCYPFCNSARNAVQNHLRVARWLPSHFSRWLKAHGWRQINFTANFHYFLLYLLRLGLDVW